MQVLVLAAQNAVDYEYLGVATSGSTLFRQIGGSIGVAAFGAIFANQLAAQPRRADPARRGSCRRRRTPTRSSSCRPAVHEAYIGALTDALAAGLPRRGRRSALLAFALTWLLREVPLKTTAQAPDVGSGFEASHDDDRLREIERALTQLAARENRWELYERGAERAPSSSYRRRSSGCSRASASARPCRGASSASSSPPPSSLAGPLERAARAGPRRDGRGRHARAHERGPRGLRAPGRRPQATACATLLDGWSPDEHPELQRLIDTLARDLVGQVPRPPAPVA